MDLILEYLIKDGGTEVGKAKIILPCIMLIFILIFIAFEDYTIIKANANEIIFDQNDICSIQVQSQSPMVSEHKAYNFTTMKFNEILYIAHFFNSLEVVEGEVAVPSDGKSFLIAIKYENGSSFYFSMCQSGLIINENLKYNISTQAYNRFLNFIYALKTEKIILDDEVTFEPSEWAKEYVEEAIESGLVPSFNQINYKGKINRLEVCQLIDNLLNQQNFTKPELTENPFSDTTDKSVIRLYHLGIIDGKNVSEFAPYDYVTREELAKILSNTYYLINPKVQPDNCTHEYADQEEISYWALNYVGDMYSLNIMIGNPENEFKPHTNVTKEELIITLLRIYM